MESDTSSESPEEEAVSRESIEDSNNASLEYDFDIDCEPSSKKYENPSSVKNSNSKSKSSKKSGLESRILDYEADKNTENAHTLTTITYLDSGDTQFRHTKIEKVDTLDGSVVILYYIDRTNGQVYFAFEVKTGTYPIPKARGKFALFGGTTKLGESSPETLSRELKEEDPDSYKILIKALKDNGRKIDEVREHVDGVPSWTPVYAAEIKDLEEWREFSSTNPTEGHKRILTLEETLLAISKNAFAFPTQGKAIYNFIIKEKFDTYLRKAA